MFRFFNNFYLDIVGLDDFVSLPNNVFTNIWLKIMKNICRAGQRAVVIRAFSTMNKFIVQFGESYIEQITFISEFVIVPRPLSVARNGHQPQIRYTWVRKPTRLKTSRRSKSKSNLFSDFLHSIYCICMAQNNFKKLLNCPQNEQIRTQSL